MPGTTRPRRLLILCIALCALSAGCGESDNPAEQPAEQVSRDTVQPIPHPDLGRLETSSRTQVEQLRERLDALRQTHQEGALLARAYGELGKLYNAHGLNDAAAVCYRNAELLAPENYQWTYYRALLFRRAGEEETAIRGLQRAVELMKLDVSVQPQQFVAALSWLGSLHQTTDDYATARLMYEQAVKINARAVQPRVGLAQLDAAEGDHQAAIARLEAVRPEIRSGSSAHNSVRYQLAMSYRALGDMARAREHMAGVEAGSNLVVADPLLQAMQGGVISSTLLVRRGKEEARAGRTGVAIDLYRQALEVDPENVFAMQQLAAVLVRSGNPEEALANLERAIELKPGSAGAWRVLSRILREQGQIERSLAAIETARRLDPGQATVELDYAQLLIENLQRPGDALVLIETVLKREPANERALAIRAVALGRTGGCEASLAALEQAYATLPTSQRLADGLARTLLGCGAEDETARTLALAEQAFEAGPGFRYAATVAMAQSAAGDYGEAVRWQEQAIELARSARYVEKAQEFEAVLHDYYRQGRPWRPAVRTLAEAPLPADEATVPDPTAAAPGEPE